MKVADLLSELGVPTSCINEMDSELTEKLVVLSRDSEGNNYSTLSRVVTEMIFVKDGYEGSVYDPNDEEGMEDEWAQEVVNSEKAKKAVVLWP